MARRERYVVGLDVGTSKVTAVVGEILEDGAVDVVGLGVAESHGIRRGVVVNVEAAVVWDAQIDHLSSTALGEVERRL